MGCLFATAKRGAVIAPRAIGFCCAHAMPASDRTKATSPHATHRGGIRTLILSERFPDPSSRIGAHKTRESSMNIVDRVKNILITPKTEWEVIAGETTPTQ